MGDYVGVYDVISSVSCRFCAALAGLGLVPLTGRLPVRILASHAGTYLEASASAGSSESSSVSSFGAGSSFFSPPKSGNQLIKNEGGEGERLEKVGKIQECTFGVQ